MSQRKKAFDIGGYRAVDSRQKLWFHVTHLFRDDSDARSERPGKPAPSQNYDRIGPRMQSVRRNRRF